MALRLRRGTDAERLLITPAEGELIYTTDTKKVYIGDGVTPGGLRYEVGGFTLSDLDDVTINPGDSTQATDGDSLLFDSASGDWRPGVPAVSGDIEVDSVTTSFDLEQAKNFLEIRTATRTTNLGSRIQFLVSGTSNETLTSVSDNDRLGAIAFAGHDGVTTFRGSVGVAAYVDGSPTVGRVPGRLTITTGRSDSIFSNKFTFDSQGKLTAPSISSENIVGNIVGDLTGSVFSDNSSTMVDAINGALIGKIQLEGTPPANSSSNGTVGEIRFDSDYIYICTANNLWKRVSLDSSSF